MKSCIKCNNYRELKDFHNCKRSKDGKRSICKSCRKTLEPTRTEYNREYYKKNKNDIIKAAIKWTKSNLDLVKSNRKSTKYKVTRKKCNKIYYEQNKINSNFKKIRNAHAALRRVRKYMATPKWANLEIIKEIYKNCPEGYHVDHIIPLKGNNICGLHIETNLQYLPAVENLRKGNRI